MSCRSQTCAGKQFGENNHLQEAFSGHRGRTGAGVEAPEVLPQLRVRPEVLLHAAGGITEVDQALPGHHHIVGAVKLEPMEIVHHRLCAAGEHIQRKQSPSGLVSALCDTSACEEEHVVRKLQKKQDRLQ